MKPAIDLIARLMLGHIFLLAGIGKISGYAGTQGYMESMGVPGALLPLVIILEIGAGASLIVGLKTQWAAAALAAFSLLAAVFFHTNFADQTQMIMFMKNVAIAGGLLMLTIHGAAAYSLDAKLGKTGA